MAFVKLDTGILDSTLWLERDVREVFITALLMAMPKEFKIEQPQIEVNSLKHTGFEAPAGWYGFVEASGPGIVNRALVERHAGLKALTRLGETESESRSHEFGGRRMIRVNGGYLILNYMKYRDRDHTAAERQRRLRERKKEKNVTRNVDTVTRDSNVTSRIAESDAESDAEKPLQVQAKREPHMAAPAFASAVLVKKAPQIPASPKPPTPFLKEGQEIGFDKFWAEYWRKDAKAIARKSYAVHVPTGVIHKLMMAGLRAQRDKYMQRDEDKRPHASTWLNQERWNDEASPVATEPKESDFVRQMMEVMADDR